MELTRGRSTLIGLVVLASAISITLACTPKSGGWGWGGQEAIILPKPTLIPKLAAAFHDGKASVNKGLIQGKLLIHANNNFNGWGKGKAPFQNGLGLGDDYGYGYAAKAPYTNVKHGYVKQPIVKAPIAYKNVHYDTSGLGGHGHPDVAYGGGHGIDQYGDYAPGFGKK